MFWVHLLDEAGMPIHNGLAYIAESQRQYINAIGWMKRLGWHWELCSMPEEHVNSPEHFPVKNYISNFDCLPPADRPNSDD
jgi:hypothetical protein